MPEAIEITSPSPTPSNDPLMTKPPVDPPAAPPPGEPAPVEYTGPEWLKGLDDVDLKGSESLKKFHDVASLAKSYTHLEKTMGKDKITILDKHASKEDWDEVYKKLGKPDSVEGYDLKINTDVILEDEVPALKKLVADSGLLPDQAQKLIDNYQNYVLDQVKNLDATTAAKLTEDRDILKKEWGDAFQRKSNEAQAAFDAVCDDADWKYIEEKGLNNDPKFVKLFSKLHDKFMGEGQIKEGGHVQNTFTPAEAQQRINNIQGDKEHPYHKKEHPNHKAAVEEVQKFFAQLSSENP